ncbi:MAG: KTSC domain-containing protein [Bauldia sp.]
MPSTVIRDFSYDEARNELTVNFRTGKVYVYTLVPPSVAAAMRAAYSKGAYFNENVRDKYRHRQIAGDTPKPRPIKPSLLDVLKASKDD